MIKLTMDIKQFFHFSINIDGDILSFFVQSYYLTLGVRVLKVYIINQPIYTTLKSSVKLVINT